MLPQLEHPKIGRGQSVVQAKFTSGNVRTPTDTTVIAAIGGTHQRTVHQCAIMKLLDAILCSEA